MRKVTAESLLRIPAPRERITGVELCLDDAIERLEKCIKGRPDLYGHLQGELQHLRLIHEAVDKAVPSDLRWDKDL